MTIYDVLRHLVEQAQWDRDGTLDPIKRAAAVKLIDALEEGGLLGQRAIDITEGTP